MESNLSRRVFDLAISTDWEYDRDFVGLIEYQANQRHLSSYVVWPGNLEETFEKLREGSLNFRFLFDRASDTTTEFFKIQKWVAEHGGQVFESLERMQWASDKATMHLEFIAHGLHAPYTIILPPHEKNKQVEITTEELTSLGRPFVIKPANTTGGGRGVVDDAHSIQDIIESRKYYAADKYLVQEKVRPLELNGRRFWFRGFYTCGLIHVAWWDDLTHIYDEVTEKDLARYQLDSLFSVVENISRICNLQFFSTEIVMSPDHKLIVVDYVNESSDMRLKSRAIDGVPDQIVLNNAVEIVNHVQKILHP